MLDCHCHLDRYANPVAIAAEAAERTAFIVAVTNLPSHFEQGLPHVRKLNRVRLSLGLHPLAAEQHARELLLFERLLPLTSFVGEVGLDFSIQGRLYKERQIETFRFVASHLARKPKVISIHSRGAEADVLATLREFGLRGAVLHWYTGPLGLINDALLDGHFFSINPCMIVSKHGQKIIERIPKEKVLTESDGPFAKIAGSPAMPWDVAVVENYLACSWQESQHEVRANIWRNFQSLLGPIRSAPIP